MQRTGWKCATAAGLMAALLMFGVGGMAGAGAASPWRAGPADAGDPVTEAIAANAPDHDSVADHVWEASDVVPVTLTGESATVDNAGVTVDAGVITVTAAGTYRFRGKLTDGQIVVNTTDEGIVRLILDGVDLASTSLAPLRVEAAAEVMVVLPERSTSTITHKPAPVEPPEGTPEPTEPPTLPPTQQPTPPPPWPPTQQPTAPPAQQPTPPPAQPQADDGKAAVLSTSNLTVTGNGTLLVDAGRDGIASKKGLVISDTKIAVDAVDDGIRGKDYLVVDHSDITATTGGTGLASTSGVDPTKGYVEILGGKATVDSGAHAFKAETDVIVGRDAVLTARSGGGSTVTLPDEDKAKGISGKVSVVLGAARITVDSASSAVHSTGDVRIAGTVLSSTSGNDGVHADGALDITSGEVTVVNSFEGIEAMRLTVSGGTVSVKASNDGVNAREQGVGEFEVAKNAFVHITGGSVSVRSGDDGIDSNGNIVISGGTTLVSTDYDGIDANGSLSLTGGTVVIDGSPVNTNWQNGLEIIGGINFTGGTLFCAGAAVVWTAPRNTSPQSWVLAKLPSKQRAGTVVQLVSGEDVIVAYKGIRDFQQVLFTSDKVGKGVKYDVYVGGEAIGAAVGGMYPRGDLTGAELVATATSSGTPPPPTGSPTPTVSPTAPPTAPPSPTLPPTANPTAPPPTSGTPVPPPITPRAGR